MSIVPVIGRELRSQARQPLTFLLRLAGAIAIGLAFWLAFSSLEIPWRHRNFVPSAAQQQIEFQNFGMALFGKINLTIFVAVWLLAPLAAADSISRERREGTLPLLQLTLLRPWEIVLGKTFVHLLRSTTLFLTMLPWLLIPFLFGGVSVQDFEMALLLDVSALLLAQSAGMVASTFSRDWLKSVIWAQVLAVLLLLAMLGGYEKILDFALRNGSAAPPPRFIGWRSPLPGLWSQMYGRPNGFIEKHSMLVGFITNGKMEYQRQWWFFGNGIVPRQFKSTWQEIWAALTPQGKALWFSGVETMFACCIATFLISIFLGAACVRASWRENVADASLENLRVKYFTPKFAVSSLRNRLRRSLSRNPIGWLHHYSASARLTKWSWCLFLIGVELFFAGNSNDLYTVQTGLGFLMVLGVLFSSVGSFRDELETGAFELLLVTPIREGQILLGRVRGIWQQFLPAFAIYAAGAVFLASGWANDGMASAAVESIARFTLLFLTAPFVGLYFSLLRWNFLVSWIGASLVTLFLPVLFRGVSAAPPLAAHEMIICQSGVAAICAWRIRRRLQNRLALSPSVLATAA